MIHNTWKKLPYFSNPHIDENRYFTISRGAARPEAKVPKGKIWELERQKQLSYS
jgi:hypothetical protein